MISPTTPTTDTVVHALNEFGLNLFRQLSSNMEKNVVMSPFSVAAALAMVFDGASGDTRDAMADTLRLAGLSRDEISAAYAGLMAALTAPDAEMQLEIANSLWIREGFPLKAEYIERNRASFGGEIAEIEFNDAAIKRINDWVNGKTHGKIRSIIEGLDPLSVMVLLNAVYFKAKWELLFDTRLTRDLPFTLKNGREKSCRMMVRGEHYSYYEDDQVQAVRLPYRGERASMIVILPSRELGLDGLLAQLNADKWNSWLDRLSQHSRVSLGLPRFKTEYDENLNATLQALGMEIAFDFKRADFRQMGPKELFYIGLVQHKTFLDVTEEGTEAAAVTKVETYFRGKSSNPEPVATMIVDRPFFLAIRDDLTGALLFLGAIVDPGDASGAGRGLATAKEIIEQHGGTIEVESKLGQGTTFRVRLPRKKMR